MKKKKSKVMTVIHANDPTTQFLSLLYEQREDLSAHITEASTNSAVQRAIRNDDTVLMLGHGNKYGLFSVPDSDGQYRRFMVDGRYVQFLREKTCIGIWCYANQFAEQYHLHGLFSGMIISELQEAIDNGITATQEEIDKEMVKFTQRLRDCIDQYGLKDTPMRMKELDDVKSELTIFNYSNLYYLE